MNNEILVAAGGTVTIDTEEYRRLVEQNAYLNMILASANDPKSYILSDITGLVDGLMKNSMAVTEDVGAQNAPPAVEGNSEETAHGEAAHAE